MFCPKCGQQQSVEDNRFCSRCGFKLRVVKALVDGDDPDAASRVSVVDPTFRRRYLTLGSIWMFIPAFLCCWLALAAPWGSLAPLFFLVVSWTLLMTLINIRPLASFFFKGPKVGTPSADNELSATRSERKQISYQSKVMAMMDLTPADQYFPPTPITGEIRKPFSVTEPTTNLLKKDPQPIDEPVRSSENVR